MLAGTVGAVEEEHPGTPAKTTPAPRLQSGPGKPELGGGAADGTKPERGQRRQAGGASGSPVFGTEQGWAATPSAP